LSLPQIDELQTILLTLPPAFCGADPCIDQSTFGSTNASTYYWSATSGPGSPGRAWSVYLLGGGVYDVLKIEFGHVRAVRGGL